VIVTPDTVLRWQRRRFREYWTKLSGGSSGGRPPVNAEIKALVSRMAVAKPSPGCSRRGAARPPRLGERSSPITAETSFALDFFTVPTAGLRVLFVVAHERRRVVHFNVTEHPTAAWTARQIVDTFPDDSAPAYLLRDRDPVYGERFRQRMKGMRIGEVLTAPHSPWQTPFVERLIGSVRRECLEHIVVFDGPCDAF
jgi:hypothetical protein